MQTDIREDQMNLKKAALLTVLCTAAFPAIGNAKPMQNTHAELTARHSPVSAFFIHLATFGHKARQ
jgi:hypothetical protein